MGELIIFTFLVFIPVAAAWQFWRKVYYRHLEQKLYRSRLRAQNNSRGNGGFTN